MMLRVADLEKGVDQSILPVGLKCNVEFDNRPSGCVTQTLPVGWNVIPAVFD